MKALDQTKAGFTTSSRNLTEFQSLAKGTATAMFVLGTAAEAAFLIMAKHAVNTADEMGKFAQKAGTTTEIFSAWAYGAGLADVEAEKLSKSFKEMSKNLIEAQVAGTPAANMFEQLGVNIRDAHGKLISADAAMLQVADRFSDTADGAGKTAAAVKLFGDKLGQDMIPFLNQGAQGIRAMNEEASLFGQVFTTEAGKAAEEFNDNIKRLKLITQGLVNVFVQALLPSLASVSSQLIDAAKDGQGIVKVFSRVAEEGYYVGRTIELTAKAVGDFMDNLEAAIQLFVKFAETGLAAFKAQEHAALNFGRVLLEVAKGPFGNVAQASATLRKDAESDLAALGVAATKTLTQVASTFQTFKKANNNLLDSMFGSGESTKLFHDIFQGMIPSGGSDKKQNPFIDSEAAAREAAKVMAQLQAIADMRGMLSVEGLRGEEMLIAQEDEKYRRQLENISKLVASNEEYYALTEQAEKNHQMRLVELHGNAIKQRLEAERATTAAIKALHQDQLRAGSKAFGDLAEAARAFGKKGFAAYKAFAIAQTIIDTYQGAQAAFTSLARIPFIGPVLGTAAAGAAIAAGMGRIASIRATDPGVAHGGLTYVPAEHEYILQKGERVLAPQQNRDFTDFISGGGSWGGSQTQVTLMIDGRVLGEVIGQIGRNGQLEIPARAVTVS